MGARPLTRNLTKLVEDSMANYLLSGGVDKTFNFGVESNKVVLKSERNTADIEQLDIIQQTVIESPRHNQA